jgi:hypothetical protein
LIEVLLFFGDLGGPFIDMPRSLLAVYSHAEDIVGKSEARRAELFT